MNDQLQTFINLYNGQGGVGNTPQNKGECVGVIEKWLVETLKNPQIWGDAFDLLNNADKTKYDTVLNTPTGIPPRGSVIVFNKSFNGTVGHTGIVTRADVNTFELFEQNNPLGSPCRLHTYQNYSFVVGWIIAKNYTVQPVVDYKALYEQTKKEKDAMQVEFDQTKVLLAQTQDKLKAIIPADPRKEQALTQIQQIINSL